MNNGDKFDYLLKLISNTWLMAWRMCGSLEHNYCIHKDTSINVCMFHYLI